MVRVLTLGVSKIPERARESGLNEDITRDYIPAGISLLVRV